MQGCFLVHRVLHVFLSLWLYMILNPCEKPLVLTENTVGFYLIMWLEKKQITCCSNVFTEAVDLATCLQEFNDDIKKKQNSKRVDFLAGVCF